MTLLHASDGRLTLGHGRELRRLFADGSADAGFAYAAVASVLVQHFQALHEDCPARDDETQQMLRDAGAALEQERD